MSNYLRNKPFLTITIIQRPNRGVKTEVSGWNKLDSNWNVLENPVVVDRINDKELRNSNVIIDLLESKVVKNGFVGTSDDEILTHYLLKYASQIGETIAEWERLHPETK